MLFVYLPVPNGAILDNNPSSFQKFKLNKSVNNFSLGSDGPGSNSAKAEHLAAQKNPTGATIPLAACAHRCALIMPPSANFSP
jgi:hypothetical protein